MEPIVDVTLTAPDADWLASFARSLVDDGLAASVNVVGQVRSFYRWQGEVVDSPEVLAVFHTRVSLVPDIIERITREHPYEVPGIRVTPVTDTLPAYQRWVIDSTTT